MTRAPRGTGRALRKARLLYASARGKERRISESRVRRSGGIPLAKKGAGDSAVASITVGADDLAPGDGSQRPPGHAVDRTPDESHAAITHQGVHSARVITA